MFFVWAYRFWKVGALKFYLRWRWNKFKRGLSPDYEYEQWLAVERMEAKEIFRSEDEA